MVKTEDGETEDRRRKIRDWRLEIGDGRDGRDEELGEEKRRLTADGRR
jgi:hypothetical protein